MFSALASWIAPPFNAMIAERSTTIGNAMIAERSTTIGQLFTARSPRPSPGNLYMISEPAESLAYVLYHLLRHFNGRAPE